MTKIEAFTYGARNDALAVMKSSAEHLISCGKTLWSPDRLTLSLFGGLTNEEIIVGYTDAAPIAAMLLTRRDEEFWPEVKQGESRFIHKLAVAPAHKGQGIGHRMLAKAVDDARLHQATYLRLDCAGDRPQLCHFYESFGFSKVKEGLVGPYFSAFYELKLASKSVEPELRITPAGAPHGSKQ